jgi:hypothetical protein
VGGQKGDAWQSSYSQAKPLLISLLVGAVVALLTQMVRSVQYRQRGLRACVDGEKRTVAVCCFDSIISQQMRLTIMRRRWFAQRCMHAVREGPATGTQNHA